MPPPRTLMPFCDDAEIGLTSASTTSVRGRDRRELRAARDLAGDERGDIGSANASADDASRNGMRPSYSLLRARGVKVSPRARRRGGGEDASAVKPRAQTSVGEMGIGGATRMR